MRLIEGSLEVKLPTIWTDGKAEVGSESEKRREEERRSEKRKSQKKEDAGAGKGRKVAIHCVFPMIWIWFVAPEGRKVGSLKRRVRSHLARWEMNKCTPLWREAHFEVKTYKAHTPFLEHFWKLPCWKSARRCGAKSKCTKTTFGKLTCRKSARCCGAKHISKTKC